MTVTTRLYFKNLKEVKYSFVDLYVMGLIQDPLPPPPLTPPLIVDTISCFRKSSGNRMVILYATSSDILFPSLRFQ